MLKDIMYGPTENDGAIPIKYSTTQLNFDVYKALQFAAAPNIRYNWQKKRLECFVMWPFCQVDYFEITEEDAEDCHSPKDLVSKILEKLENK